MPGTRDRQRHVSDFYDVTRGGQGSLRAVEAPAAPTGALRGVGFSLGAAVLRVTTRWSRRPSEDTLPTWGAPARGVGTHHLPCGSHCLGGSPAEPRCPLPSPSGWRQLLLLSLNFANKVPLVSCLFLDPFCFLFPGISFHCFSGQFPSALYFTDFDFTFKGKFARKRAVHRSRF